jgi:hypothetical protein
MAKSAKYDGNLHIALTQYEAASIHHLGFYNLIWQLPSVAIAIGGGLTSIVFGAGIPAFVRIFILILGTIFIAAMTIALERFRMFQIRRRNDLEDIQNDLKKFGARQFVWGGDEIVHQIDRGALSSRGLPLRHFEGFTLLRGLMYLITASLFGLTLLAIAAAYGIGPLVSGH